MSQPDALEEVSAKDFRVVSEERLYGAASRWRRFGEPVPAGGSRRADGTIDYGLFGPGSMVWEVLLHPATIVFESLGQSLLQLTYKPITAGIRDHDPLSRKAMAGTMTYFDAFERFQRNAGMHAPMWLGDSITAAKMADHLHRVHKRVAGDIIDVAEPELGGYDASGPRDAMWAALTEMDAILHVYEAVAFRGDEPPRRLTPEQRDRYYAEVGAYLRLVGAEEVPANAAEVDDLYRKYDHLFGHGHTIHINPRTGQNSRDLSAASLKNNYHPSQAKAAGILKANFGDLREPILGALPERTRRHAGLNDEESQRAVQALQDQLPKLREMQGASNEADIMRLLWGPDGVMLIEEARLLHHTVLAGTA